MHSRYRDRLATVAAVLALAGCASGQREIERDFGYPTVQAAFEGLKARRDVKMTSQDGWTIIEDPVNSILWSFVPANHPAYPAVIRRQIVDREGRNAVGMSALCQGPRPACDKLVEEMRAVSEPHPPAEPHPPPETSAPK
jgi:hypothetical protein